MIDEKDLEIARLKGRLEVAEGRRPSVAIGTLKVVGTLVVLSLAVIAALVAFGSANPRRTYPERLEVWRKEIDRICEVRRTGSEDARDACVVHLRQTRPVPDA
jgi:hypothetical protein